MAYTCLHLLIMAGIIVCAVAYDLSLHDPRTLASPVNAAVLLGGPALYLGGNALLKQAVNLTHLPRSHLIGLARRLALGLTYAWLPIAGLRMDSTAVLVIVAVWEMRSLREARRAMETRETH